MRVSAGVAMMVLALSGGAALAQQSDALPTGVQAVQPVPVVPAERPVTGNGAVAPEPVREAPRTDASAGNGQEVPRMGYPPASGRQ